MISNEEKPEKKNNEILNMKMKKKMELKAKYKSR